MKPFLKVSESKWLNTGGGNIVKIVDVATPTDDDGAFLAIEYNFVSFDYDNEQRQHVEFLDGSERDALLSWLAKNCEDLTARKPKYASWVLPMDDDSDADSAPLFTHPYKVGDKLRFVSGNQSVHEGEIVTIIEVDPSDDIAPYWVRFSDGSTSWLDNDEYEPVTEEPATDEPHFCHADGCELPAANRDNYGEWYCADHFIPF